MKEKEKNLSRFTQIVDNFINSLSEDEKEQLLNNIEEVLKEPERIAVDDWRNTHPDKLSCASDTYYVKLVNKILEELARNNLSQLPEGSTRLIAISCAAYLEDIVNGFGVWDAFRTLHREMYGTLLPFYDTASDEYMTDNVNIEDIQFIIWQSFSRCGIDEEIVYSPYSTGISTLSEIVYDILVDEFEKAPESKRIADYIDRNLGSRDYFQVRNVALWLNLDNPLTALPGLKRTVVQGFTEQMDKKNLPADVSNRVLYAVLVGHAWRPATGPLGNHTRYWLAAMARQRGLDKQATRLEEFTIRAAQSYRIVSRDKAHIILEDYSGENLAMRTDSMEKSFKLGNQEAFNTRLVNFGGEWLQDGIAFPVDKFTPSEKIGLDGMPPVAREFFNGIIDSHGGRQVFVFKNGTELDKFIANDKGILLEDLGPDDKNVVLFLSRTEFPMTMVDAAQFFKIPGNRKYSRKKTEIDGLSVLEYHLSDDVAKYIQDNNICPDMELYAYQGSEFGRKIMRENFRFYCGFYRNY